MAFFSGIFGVIVILLIAFLLSNNKRRINLRSVLGAFCIQLMFAILILYVPAGKNVLQYVAHGVNVAIQAGVSGVNFLFGGLATGEAGFVFAVNVLPLIVFSSSLVAVLYYIKVMPLIINTLGLGLHKLLGTSRAESLSATSNIFLGQTEAPLVVRPFVKHMTKSEIFAIMTGGLASVAGSVLAGYAALGIQLEYLIAAAFMSAPGGLLMAKIIWPETETPLQTLAEVEAKEGTISDAYHKPVNVIEAAAEGASIGLHLALNVGAMLIAFIGLVTLVDNFLEYIGHFAGIEHLTFKLILGYVFAPFAFVMGVPLSEAVQVGAYLGDKIIFNEFVAYVNFTKDMAMLSEKSQIITIFALCGFANVSSIGMLVGGLGVIAPNYKSTIASMAFKAVLAGTLSNFLSASLAGMLLLF